MACSVRLACGASMGMAWTSLGGGVGVVVAGAGGDGSLACWGVKVAAVVAVAVAVAMGVELAGGDGACPGGAGPAGPAGGPAEGAVWAGCGVDWRLSRSPRSLSFFWLLCSLPILSKLPSRTMLRSWAARSWLVTCAVVLACVLARPRSALSKLADGGATCVRVTGWMLARRPVRNPGCGRWCLSACAGACDWAWA